MKKTMILGVMALSAAALAGCTGAGNAGGSGVTPAQASAIERSVRASGDYWERTQRVSAQYMVGPKAQHQLNMDIASCVAQVRELVRLGSIRSAQPPAGVAMDPGMASGWTPATRNGPLYTEYTDFQDFDGCMKSKGWERSDFVRPNVAVRATRNYNTTILGMGPGMDAQAQTTDHTARYDSMGNDTGTNGFNN